MKFFFKIIEPIKSECLTVKFDYFRTLQNFFCSFLNFKMYFKKTYYVIDYITYISFQLIYIYISFILYNSVIRSSVLILLLIHFNVRNLVKRFSICSLGNYNTSCITDIGKFYFLHDSLTSGFKLLKQILFIAL